MRATTRCGIGVAVGMALALTGPAATAIAAGPPGANPDNRAYEMVSPQDKGGVPLSPADRTHAAPSGDAVVFPATGAIGGASTSLNYSYYLSRRSSDGWSFDPVDPPLDNSDVPLGMATRFMSTSLDSTFQFSTRALAPGAQEGASNAYVRDNRTGQRKLLATAPGSQMMLDLGAYGDANSKVAANGDLSHVVFATKAQLVPEAQPFVKNLYELTEQGVRLVNVMPDGTPAPNGEFSFELGALRSTAVSQDGRRVYFGSTPSWRPPGLYLRQDGTTTIPISYSRLPEDDPSVVVSAKFAAASADGGTVYFTSDSRLTTGVGNGSIFLYRYEVETDELTLVSKQVPGSFTDGTQRVYAASADGSALYFLSDAALTEDAPKLATPKKLYRFDDDGITYIAAVASPPKVGVSDNSRYLAFSAADAVSGYDNGDARCRPSGIVGDTPPSSCLETYVYDSVTDGLECVTCIDSGRPNGHSFLPSGGAQQLNERVSRAVTDDGRVFFSSEEALVPEDVNGKYDAYQWRDGELTLISSGRDAENSFFVEASPDGDDVFFMTSERLVAADVDDSMDLYDARVGGGIAAQNVAPPARRSCDGDDCQGPLLAPPAADLLGSLGLGAGDPGARRPVTVRASLVAGSARGASFALRVRTAGRGRIVMSGSGLRRSTKAVRGAEAAVHHVRLRLDAGARKRLQRNGRLRVRAKVTFAAVSGARSVSFVSVTLKRPAHGGAKGGLR